MLRAVCQRPKVRSEILFERSEIKECKFSSIFGVVLSYDLKWAEHLKKIIAKSYKLMGMLYRVLDQLILELDSWPS